MAFGTGFAHFFVSPFSETTAVDELNTFLAGNRIINVEKQLIDSDRGTGWVFLVEYATQSSPGKPAGQQKIDYREILSAHEFARYDHLRQVRKQQAELHGVPVYAIFTNDHLAAMAKNLPQHMKEIAALPKVGNARVQTYGTVFLDACQELASGGHEAQR